MSEKRKNEAESENKADTPSRKKSKNTSQRCENARALLPSVEKCRPASKKKHDLQDPKQTASQSWVWQFCLLNKDRDKYFCFPCFLQEADAFHSYHGGTSGLIRHLASVHELGDPKGDEEKPIKPPSQTQKSKIVG